MMLALLAAGTLAASQATDELHQYAAEMTETFGAPGAAVIVVKGEGTEIGFAGQRQAGLDAPVEEDDLWHIGSNAKAMTAMLALSLAEEGTIALDTTVTEQLGDDFNIDEGWSGVTLAQLLGHRSGAAANTGRLTALRYILFPNRSEDGPSRDREQVLRGVLKNAPETAPGTSFTYSNLGYTIAGAMLADAAGTTFVEALDEELFTPLGMDDVRLGVPEGAPGTVNRGHRGSPPEPAPAGADNPAFMAPAGTFSLSAESYAAFLADQLAGHSGDEALLPTERYRQMATAPDDLDAYGYGWAIGEEGRLQHAGSNTMWYVVAVIAPAEGVAAAVLLNAAPDGNLGDAVHDLVTRYAE